MLREFLYKSKAKAELIKVFRSAGLHKTYKSKGGSERTIFPQIHDIHIDKENKSLRYTFTLLNGMDPKEVAKKEYVFRQHFGRSITIEGDLKKYVLTIYASSMPNELIYNADEVREEVESFKLGIICGKDRNGRYVSFDMLKQPHLLIAGETGSGKSTQLRSILTTLIRTKKPSEMKLFLGDCKKSEFHIFRKVEHVQCVLSSAKDIARMLRSIKKELDERSDLTEIFEVGHADDLPAEHRRPYLVVCIDEFVMLRKNEEIMEILTEITAIGRTLGVYAILSMQRPNAKVLDTTIRANLTVSMGFKLRDVIESRIVNTPGAENIESEGRFIMNSKKLYELQAPYLTDKKARELLNPFIVSKGPVKEVTPEEPAIKELTEKDVFNDVVD
ncbi:FtsK/SpoIIIE domain-containing protein [Peribacillus simplex]|uniref:FtsK/SpoIIIE domain-containing protein n=1 Tax=Peribacillus simplex TaxID=1478 RepID=UPI00298DF4EB|nr:FtsK/SpoIIIE domain-containing protein [Peribacillus simplex]MDW7616989.1 FtsK/SpoIIIE domain-containing protein [Peribacillus simplex]